MCEFCEEHWIEKYQEYAVEDMSDRIESKHNDGLYTGIQTFIDLDTSQLTIIACLDNKYIKPILKHEHIDIEYCPKCGRKL